MTPDELTTEAEGQESPQGAKADSNATAQVRSTLPGNPNDPLADYEDLQKALHDLYLKCMAEDRYPRLLEVKDVKRAEYYWTGRQYLWWSNDRKSWNLPDQGQSIMEGDQTLDDMPRFEFVTNIYQATGLTVIGAVASKPPRYRFFPNDADNPDDLETAKGRTKLAKLIERWNPPQTMLQEETYHAWTGGVVTWWCRYIENGEKYGIDPESNLAEGEEQPEATIHCPKCGWSAPAMMAEPPVPCPQCGTKLTDEDISEELPIPTLDETPAMGTPKGREAITVYGALNCKRPQHVKSQSQYHYFALEEELHYSTLKAAFPDKADQIKAGLDFGADDGYERNARLSVLENTRLLTQSGAAQANLVTFARVWFRPSAFWMLEDEKQRDALLEIFPRGCRAEFAGPIYCVSEAQSMDDCLVVKNVMPGSGQHRPAIGTACMSLQDRFNTMSNIETETYEYGIPITYRAASTFSTEADDDQRAAPGLEVEVALRPDEDINMKIKQVRADSVSADMAAYTRDLMGGQLQYISGVFPALTGAAEGAPETLGQQGMQRDQAMGRQGVFYVNLKQGKADIMTLACRDFEAHSEGQVKMPVFGKSGDFESESVDITALEGEAEAYPEGDETFPVLWNQQRATIMQIMDTDYGKALVTGSPDNGDVVLRLIGVDDLKIPGGEARQKQLREIAEMTKIPEGEGMLAGIAPMVSVDPQNDYHQQEADTCQIWLNSEEGQRVKRENPLGWQAVSEHRQQHLQAIPKPQPVAPPPKESVTAALKDMPPEAQAQWLAKELGIQVGPQDFAQQALLEHFKKNIKPPTGAPGQGGPPASGSPKPAVPGA